MDQVRGVPFDRHDAHTQYLANAHGASVDIRAAGGELDPEATEANRRMRLTSLDESLGEGFHRRTAHEKRRAPSSSQQHIKESVYDRESIEACPGS